MVKTSKISVTTNNSSNLFTKKLISILAGIYVAMFWVADAKYGNAVSRLEARTTNLVTRLESDGWRKVIELVPSLQNRKIPVRPSFFYPPDVVHSLIPFYDRTDLEVIEELQNLIISKKSELHNLDLKYVILEKSDFSKSNLKNSNLKFSNFSNSSLNYASLENSHLENVDFTSSELQGTVLTGSNMEGCILTEAKLFGTELENVNLSNSNLSSCNLHLSNLSGAMLYNSDLSQTNLVGVNFENVKGLDKANLNNAKYNSLNIEQSELPSYNEIVLKLCEKLGVDHENLDLILRDDCIQEVLKNFELSYGPPKISSRF